MLRDTIFQVGDGGGGGEVEDDTLYYPPAKKRIAHVPKTVVVTGPSGQPQAISSADQAFKRAFLEAAQRQNFPLGICNFFSFNSSLLCCLICSTF
jgi:hypothetical protein